LNLNLLMISRGSHTFSQTRADPRARASMTFSMKIGLSFTKPLQYPYPQTVNQQSKQ